MSAAYRTILVPTDASGSAGAATAHALALADRFDARIEALYVLDDRYLSGDVEGITEAATVESALQADGEEAVGAVVERAREHGLDAEGTVRRGVPSRTIVEFAAEVGADLIAMGTHGRGGLERLLLGSVAERVVRRSPIPVLTVRESDDDVATEYDALLIPTDGSDAASTAAEHGLDLAERFDAHVHAYSVVDTRVSQVDPLLSSFRDFAEEAVADIADRARQRGLGADTAVEDGTPAAGIVGHSEELGVDLIVMGTHGRTGLDRMAMGSVAERVVRTSSLPVITVRSRAE